MTDLASIQAIVYGHVQGVFFRDFVFRRATELGLTGYVRNLPDGGVVEVNAEPTPLTQGKISDYLIQGKTGKILPRIVEEIKKIGK